MKPKITTQFKRDVKRAKRQNRDLSLLKTAIDALLEGKQLPQEYKDHKLKGRLVRYRECHLEPDWLLMYQVTTDGLILVRLGSHSELFE